MFSTQGHTTAKQDHARIALKSLILLFVRLIARGARIGKTHTQTHRHTDRTSTVTIAHARRGLTSTVTLAHARRGLIMFSTQGHTTAKQDYDKNLKELAIIIQGFQMYSGCIFCHCL